METEEWEEHDFTQDYFDWNRMANEYPTDGAADEISKNEVAHLMKCTGLSVNTNYYETESGASVTNVAVSMHRYFNYSADAVKYSKNLYDEAKWYGMIRENIDADRPVIYYGEGSGAHAFVVDGYDLSDNYHVNWGWDGIANGYYALDALCPLENSFNENQGMIVNMHPGTGEEIWSDCFMAPQDMFEYLDYISHINISVNDVKKGEEFDFVSGYLCMPHGFKGTYGIVHTDKDLRIKSILCSRTVAPNNSTVIMGSNVNFYGIKTEENVDEGDRLYIAAMENDDKEWRLVKQNGEEQTSVSMKGNMPEWCEVEWVTDPRLRYEIHDGFNTSRNSMTGEELNRVYGKVLKGSFYMVHPEGFSPSDGDYTAVKVNDRLEVVCENVYPVIISPTFMNDSYKIEFLGSKKEDRYDMTVEGVTPGNLEEKLRGKKVYDIENLKVSGTINGSDMEYLCNNIPFMSVLDLSSARCEGMATIGTGRFIQSFMRSVSLPEGVKETSNLFATGAVKYLTLPSTIERTGAMMCRFETGASVFVKSMSVPEVSFDAGSAVPEKGTLYVMPGMAEAFRAAPYWREFTYIEENPNPIMVDVTEIRGGIIYSFGKDHYTVTGATEECPENPEFAENLTYNGTAYPVSEIGERAFLYNKNIRIIHLPKSITKIGRGAFTGSMITEFDGEDNSFTILPDDVFGNASVLKNVRIPEGVTELGQYVISDAQHLEEISLPSTLKTIAVNSIMGHNLKEINLAEGNPYLKTVDGALYSHDMTRLHLYPMGQKRESIRVPEGVKYMNWQIFPKRDESYAIKELILPSSLLHIPLHTIHTLATGLESFVIPDNVHQVDQGSVPLVRNTVIGKNVGKPITDANITNSEMKEVTVRQWRHEGDRFMRETDVANVYLENEATISLIDFFGGDVTDQKNPVRVFSPMLTPNFSIVIPGSERPNMLVFVPGGVKGRLSNQEKEYVEEMWEYAINTTHGRLAVRPLYPFVEIDEVEINGRKSENQDGAYSFTPSGETIVTIKYTLNGIHSTTTVYDAEYNAEAGHGSFILTAESKYLGAGEKMKADVTVLAPDETVILWSSSDETIATVDGSGEISANKPGRATISAKSQATGETRSMELTVYDISCDMPEKTGTHESDFCWLTGNIKVEGLGENVNVEAICENPYIEQENYSITPDNTGAYQFNFAVRVPCKQNITARCIMPDMEKTLIIAAEVYRMIDHVTPGSEEEVIETGESRQLTVNIYPSDAGYQELLWESEYPEVATVDETGMVTGISAGSTFIRARTTDGSDIETSCRIVVTEKSAINDVAGYRIMVRGENRTIIVTGAPEGTEITVHDVSGKCIYHGTKHVVSVDLPGVYIISAGDMHFKTVIR